MCEFNDNMQNATNVISRQQTRKSENGNNTQLFGYSAASM